MQKTAHFLHGCFFVTDICDKMQPFHELDMCAEAEKRGSYAEITESEIEAVVPYVVLASTGSLFFIL